MADGEHRFERERFTVEVLGISEAVERLVGVFGVLSCPFDAPRGILR